MTATTNQRLMGKTFLIIVLAVVLPVVVIDVCMCKSDVDAVLDLVPTCAAASVLTLQSVSPS
jgi:hypothetical protein